MEVYLDFSWDFSGSNLTKNHRPHGPHGPHGLRTAAAPILLFHAAQAASTTNLRHSHVESTGVVPDPGSDWINW